MEIDDGDFLSSFETDETGFFETDETGLSYPPRVRESGREIRPRRARTANRVISTSSPNSFIAHHNGTVNGRRRLKSAREI
ncbi:MULTISPECIES: hypothetical protein [Bartonella]|uniref:Uncharacterized protein n=1 Tax=Bartonella choladocola TaxID=2750995 RepID=A0A1U9ME11_9HYPH|nr:hypothetical protein [Bartonella choladocola]AQT46167.1 hypothetical protein BBC0122_000260 [Bartonella choladocola]MBI0139544.1 hypothetical protein [Bartonella choladocola]